VSQDDAALDVEHVRRRDLPGSYRSGRGALANVEGQRQSVALGESEHPVDALPGHDHEGDAVTHRLSQTLEARKFGDTRLAPGREAMDHYRPTA
jgi:hypothetical protein